MNDSPTPSRPGSRRGLIGFLALAFLFVCIGMFFYFKATKPKADRRPRPSMQPVVEVIALAPETRAVEIRARGTVIPARQINLPARVTGQILAVHPAFHAGGRIQAGEVLVEIDDLDYQRDLAEREAALETARNNLRLEAGQQAIAEREWAMLGGGEEVSDEDRNLALRKPQLRSLEAVLRSMEAAVEQARANLDRCRVTAPFNAQIQAIYTDIGDLATPQSPLAMLVDIDRYRARISVPMSSLPWLVLPGPGGEAGSPAELVDSLGTPWPARLVALQNDLEPNGRLARLLLDVDNPLGQGDGHTVPLLLGDYVSATLIGRVVEDVFVIPRTAVHEGNEIWVASRENQLTLRPVEPLWADADVLLVRDALGDGERLIVSGLSTPVQGMALRIAGEAPRKGSE